MKKKTQPSLFPVKRRRASKRKASPAPVVIVTIDPAIKSAVNAHGLAHTLGQLKSICLEESGTARAHKDKPLAKVWARKAKILDGFRQRIERL